MNYRIIYHTVMSNFLENGYWILWWYFIVIYPSKIIDFYKDNKKTILKYAGIIIDTIICLASVINTFISQKTFHLVNNKIIYFLLIVAYLQCLVEYIENKTKRNLFFLLSFSLFIVIYLTLIIHLWKMYLHLFYWCSLFCVFILELQMNSACSTTLLFNERSVLLHPYFCKFIS